MSGLIWAGIGKGIADAGQTFGGYMAKDIEATRLEEREALREERLLKRQEALEQLKADRKLADEETLRKRVATESVEIQSRAAGAPARRESAALGRDAQALAKSSAQAGEEGDTALSEDQLKGLMQSAPKLRESYAKSGMIGGAIKDKMDPRLREAEDQVQAALEIGAHSSVIDAYSKQRRDVLDQIRLENAKEKGDQQHQAQMAAITERGRQADQRLPVLQQQADAATTRANRPAGEATEKNITAAENALTNARAKVEKGYREPTMQEKYDPAALEAYTKKRKEYVDNHPDVKRQSARVERLNAGGADTAPPARPLRKAGDNAGARPPLSSFVR